MMHSTSFFKIKKQQLPVTAQNWPQTGLIPHVSIPCDAFNNQNPLINICKSHEKNLLIKSFLILSYLYSLIKRKPLKFNHYIYLSRTSIVAYHSVFSFKTFRCLEDE